MPVVTISASYAAGGSQLAPRVADRLGVPFVDRAIPVAVARELGVTVEEAEAVAQNAPSRLWALFAGMASTPEGFAVPGSVSQLAAERNLIEQTEAHMREIADSGDCVLLGRAGAIVLAERTERTLHVRLDGAPEGRIRAAMGQHGIDYDTAVAAQKKNDKIRSGYVKHFYGSDSADPKHYHLVLDTVRLGWDRAEEIIVRAAELVDQG